MNFKRRRIKGAPKHYKEWRDETKQYRIHWRDRYAGIEVIPGYYACVRCVVDGHEYWGFVGRQGTYRTLKAAIKECETNMKIWERFLAIEGRAKVAQVRELKDEYIRGTVLRGRSILRDLPIWAAHRVSGRLMHILRGKKVDDD